MKAGWVTAAAFVVIAFGVGVLVYWQWRDRTVAAATATAAQEAGANARSAQMLAECRALIAAWDSGNRVALLDQYAGFAQDVVDDCRRMIPFWEDALAAELIPP